MGCRTDHHFERHPFFGIHVVVEITFYFLEGLLLRFANANSQHCTTSSLTDMLSSCAILDNCSFKSFEIRKVLLTYSVFLILNSNFNHLSIILNKRKCNIYTI